MNLYDVLNGNHRHECPECKTVWTHPNFCAGSDEDHVCPKCGTEEWDRYHGRKKPKFEFIDHGDYKLVPPVKKKAKRKIAA